MEKIVYKNTVSVHVLGFMIGVILCCLKLNGHIDWSWFWVTMPFWVTYAVTVFIVVLTMILAFSFAFLKVLSEKSDNK